MAKTKRAAILIERDYQEMEVWYPYYRLKEAGCEVDFVAPEVKIYEGKYGYPASVTKTFKAVNGEIYDAVIVPGGFAPDYLRRHRASIDFVVQAAQKGKIVAAICHGPWILASADLVRDKKVTCFSAIADDIKNAGGLYSDAPVVTDGRLITSRQPDDLPAFCQAIIKALSL